MLARSLLAAPLLLVLPGCGSPAPRQDPVTGMTFVWVPPGHFLMGSPPGETERGSDETPHLVRLSRGFWLGRTEVTRAQWEHVMGPAERHLDKPNPFRGLDPNLPMVAVSFDDVQAFLRQAAARNPGARYRLPTEAEWEYACRAGRSTAFHTGDGLPASAATFDGTVPYAGAPSAPGPGRPSPVGTHPPNAWGLADLHGNVWEWTADGYGPYPPGPVTDPHGPPVAPLKVIRGGSWAFHAGSARSACRYTHAPGDGGHSLGFRVIWEP
jgi:formylglycine-generating enzyme required for sulfatase activity